MANEPTRFYHTQTQVYIRSVYSKAEIDSFATKKEKEAETGRLLAGYNKAVSEGLEAYTQDRDGLSLPPRPGVFV